MNRFMAKLLAALQIKHWKLLTSTGDKESRFEIDETNFTNLRRISRAPFFSQNLQYSSC
jgi:hypothetical protein